MQGGNGRFLTFRIPQESRGNPKSAVSPLGLDHLTREDIIDKQTSQIASRLLDEGRHPCILLPDGTYLYIQVRSNNFLENNKLLKIRKVEIM